MHSTNLTAPPESTITFHIIYTVGTVQYLTLFVRSLLHYSQCRYVLVSNHCTEQEDAYLQHFCEQDQRLSFIRLPTDEKMWPHGKTLDYLYARTDSEYFCFMDSDIFATRPFMADFLARLADSAGVFTGTATWHLEEEQIVSRNDTYMAGRHNRTSKGVCLGSTYFAIYNRQALEGLSQQWPVSWKNKSWDDLVDAKTKELIVEMDLRFVHYDTGKLLHIRLLAENHALSFLKTDALRHLGGFSRLGRVQKRKSFTRSLIKRYRRLKRSVLRIRIAGIFDNQPIFESRRKRIARRQRYGKHGFVYFSSLLMALIDNQPSPSMPKLGDPELQHRMEVISRDLMLLYKQFGKEPFSKV